MSHEQKPGTAIVVAVIGAVGLIAAAVLQSGLLSPLLSGTVASTPAATSPAVSASASPSVAASPVAGVTAVPVGLPNEIRRNVSSVRVKYGCGILFGSASDDTDQLRICENTPALPAAWRNRVKRVSADCSTVSDDHILVFLWAGEQYSGGRYEYAFGC